MAALRMLSLIALATLLAVHLTTATAATGDLLLPNLRIDPPSNLLITSTQIRFDTVSRNDGAGPLELRSGGITTAGGVYRIRFPLQSRGASMYGAQADDRQRVIQRIYEVGGTSRERLAGEFLYHPGHGHLHVEDFALYELRPDGSSEASARASKVTFCVIDIVHSNPTLVGSPVSPGYRSCGNADQIANERQGLSVGWADRYDRSLEGQSLSFVGLPPGQYTLRFTIDPLNQIQESDDSDNSSELSVTIGS